MKRVEILWRFHSSVGVGAAGVSNVHHLGAKDGSAWRSTTNGIVRASSHTMEETLCEASNGHNVKQTGKERHQTLESRPSI